MGTELAKVEIPPSTPQIARSLSQQELVAHRATIAFEVRTVLSAYFQPHEAEEVKAAQLAWWCDEMEDWTQEQVVWGLRRWNRDNPRLRPTPGDIVAVLKDARGRKVAAQLPKPEPEPEREITPEELAHRKAVADEVMAEFKARSAMRD